MMKRMKRQVSTMTDKELDEIDALTPEERSRIFGRKDTFALNKNHMSIIVNDLLRDDDAKLGRIMRDLVAFNIDGTTDLVDNVDEHDPADRTARHLLYDDAVVLINHYMLTALHNSHGGKRSKSKNADAETDGEQVQDNDRPTLGDICDFATMCLGGVPEEEQKKISRQWYDSMTKHHWLDDKGVQIHEWRKVFEKYAKQTWLKKATDKL